MSEITINDVLNEFQKLDDSDKEYFLEVARKQIIEYKRSQIAEKIKEADQNYRNGKTISGNSEKLLSDLEHD